MTNPVDDNETPSSPRDVDSPHSSMDKLDDDIIRFRDGTLMRNSDRLDGVRILDLAMIYKQRIKAIEDWQGNVPQPKPISLHLSLILWGILLLPLIYGIMVLVDPQVSGHLADYLTLERGDPRNKAFLIAIVIVAPIWLYTPMTSLFKRLTNRRLDKWRANIQLKQEDALKELSIRYPEEYAAWQELVEVHAVEADEARIEQGLSNALEVEKDTRERHEKRQARMLADQEVRVKRYMAQQRKQAKEENLLFVIPVSTDSSASLLSTEATPVNSVVSITDSNIEVEDASPSSVHPFTALDEIERDTPKIKAFYLEE